MARIDVIEKGDGWLIVKLRDPADASPAASAEISDKLTGWLSTHRGATVRAALPIVSGGETIALHVWTEQPAK